jgi:TrmH family RNA methyltransferase
MTTITSPQNPQLQDLRRLLARRRRDGRFAAEGEDLVDAARRAGWEPLAGFRAAGSYAGGPGFTEVDGALLGRISLLGSGTRVVGVYRERWAPAPLGPLCVYLHGVRDPGNVGAVVRSAHAFGAASVAVGPDCADPFGPRAVRASMGAIFAVPVARGGPLPGTHVALAAGAGEPLDGAALPAQLTLMVGAEREGLPAELLAGADRVAHIPMRAGDSLNAAMAATIALYELTRVVGPTPCEDPRS